MTELAVAPAPAATDVPESPYKGLLPYAEADTAFFYGRETERELIAANLMAARLTVLYGPSGVGKSSVLHAGVAHDLHELARDRLADEDSPGLALVVFRTWHGDVSANLAVAIADAVRQLLPDEDHADPPADAPLDGLLDHWARTLDGRLLVVLDQFEEYFLYAGADDRFGAELPEAVNRPGLRANFLISIREDALAKLDRFKGRIPNLFDNYLRIDRLDLRAARQAIERPVAKWTELSGERVEIEAGLVEAVLEQVRPDLSFGQAGTGTATDARPDRIETTFLQLVMRRLWEKERAEGSSVLRASTLADLGGAPGIVRAHLDDAVGRLTPADKDVAAHIFRFLVTRSGQKVAHTAADLAAFADLDLQAVSAVLARLAERDVSILRRVDAPAGESETEPRYEIYHDTLGEAVLAWRARYVEKRQREEAEVHAREVLRAAARRRWRRVLLTTGVVLAAAVVTALVWVYLDAAREGRIADSRALAASAMSILPSDPERSVSLAAAAERKHDTPEAAEALRRALGESRLRSILPAPANLQRVSFVGNGAFVVGSAEDGRVTVWDSRTHERWLVVHGDHMRQPAVAVRGNLVVVRRSGVYEIWNVKEKKLVSRFAHPGDDALSPVLSADGRWLATTSGNQVRIRDVTRRARPRVVTITAGRRKVEATALTASGDRVATATADAGIRIWDLASPSRFVALHRGFHGATSRLVFSPDGHMLLAVGADGRARAWSSDGGRLLATLQGTDYPVTDAAFSPNSRLALTVAGTDVTVWDAKTWRPLAIRRHADYVSAASFSPNSHLVLTATRVATAWVWGARTGQALLALPHSNAVTSAEFSPDGRLAITASPDRAVRMWDVDTGSELVSPGRGHPVSAAFSPDGRVIATGGDDGFARIWDARTHKLLKSVHSNRETILGVAVDSTGTRVATASRDDTAAVWNWKSGRLIRLRGHDGDVITVDFAPDGRVVTSSLDGTARVWTPGSRRRPLVLRRGTSYVVAGTFSPDGSRIATTGWDNTVKIWNSRSGTLLRTLRGHGGDVNAVAFSPDGRRLVSAGLDKIAIVWDAGTGRRLRTLRGHTGPLWDAHFSPDGRQVVTAGADATARVWDVKNGTTLAVIHRGTSTVNNVEFDPADPMLILTATLDGVVQIGRCETCPPIGKLLELADARTRALRR